MHGVNTGGWLVTEYWINSNDKVFEGVDPQVVNFHFVKTYTALTNLQLSNG